MTEDNKSAKSHDVSIVVLTQGEREELGKCLLSIAAQDPPFCQVIIVNNSSLNLELEIPEKITKNTHVITAGGNFGTAARNIGAFSAKSKFLVFIDDDIVLLGRDIVRKIDRCLSQKGGPSAVCFMVRSMNTGDYEALTWGHPRDRIKWQDKAFVTDNITEGAFAIDSNVFRKAGGFWPGIFVGEEGDDLFIRILKMGGRVVYEPQIECIHLHAADGRQALRGFYHYARSDVLITWRHLRLSKALAFMISSCGMLFLQALRQFRIRPFMYIFLGLVDGLSWIIGGSVSRGTLQRDEELKWKEIRSCVPPAYKRMWRQLTEKNL